MWVCRTVVTSLLGALLLAPLTLAPAQAARASRGAGHNSQVPNASICGTPRFDFWYGYYYYPYCRCWDHGWLRLCRAGKYGWPRFR